MQETKTILPLTITAGFPRQLGRHDTHYQTDAQAKHGVEEGRFTSDEHGQVDEQFLRQCSSAVVIAIHQVDAFLNLFRRQRAEVHQQYTKTDLHEQAGCGGDKSKDTVTLPVHTES